MNELLNQFEKETGNRVDFYGPKIYRDKYVQWLEAKAQKTEVSEEALEKARQYGYEAGWQDGYEAGWQDSANHIANTL